MVSDFWIPLYIEGKLLEKELRRLGNARFMVSDTGLIRAVSVGRFVPTQTKMESTQWHSIKNIRIEKSHTNALSFTLSPYMRSGPLNKFRVVNCNLAHLVHCRSVHIKVWKPRMDHWVSVNECPCWKARGSVSVCVCERGWESCHFEEWETVAVGSSLADVQKEHEAYWSIKYANSSCWLKREINKVQ